VIRKLSAVIFLSSIVLAPRLARAQRDATQVAVAPDSIVVLGLRRVDRKQALDQSGLTAGHALGYRDVQRAIQNLYASGQYDDVRVSQDTAAGRQILVV
jgi:outer membrane protein assembly factor BamA